MNQQLSSALKKSSKRKAICFESSTTPKRRKLHIPKLTNVTWNKDTLLSELQNWPHNTRINWSEVARRHEIPGRNGGQVAKEFATMNGIDVFALDGRPDNIRVRAQKRKMPGQEISIPTLPTVDRVKLERDKLIRYIAW